MSSFIKTITSIEDYMDIEEQIDNLWEKPENDHEMHLLIDLLSMYEEQHPEQVSRIYGDNRNLPEDTDFECFGCSEYIPDLYIEELEDGS